jgi:Ca2+-binding RTX toxin-like protein
MKKRIGTFIVLSGAMMLVLLVMVAPSALAVTDCGFAGGVVTVTIDPGESVILSVDTTPTPDEIVWDNDGTLAGAAQCGTADVTTTGSIVVTGSTGNESFFLDLTGGVFEPGTPAEGSGTAEIEFSIDLGTNTGDLLTVTGGAGAENLAFGSSGINLNGAETTDDADVTLTNIENFTVNAGGGGDTVSGAGVEGSGTAFASALTLNGEAGVDSLTGGNANDTLNGGATTDNDTLNGGAGTDLLTYAGIAAALTVNLSTTAAQSTGGAGSDTISTIENLTGGSVNDTLTGSTVANAISGAAGDDSLTGGDGDDVLTGDDGNDTMIGGNGNDTINGGNNTDTVSFTGTTAAVLVDLSVTTGQNTGVGTDTITNTENATGGTGADTLKGSTGDNVLNGADGNDILSGGDGNDTLTGGNGTDKADYSAAAAGVTANLSTGTATGQGTDTLSGVENVAGSAFADSITGSTGANAVAAGAGDDVVSGQDGNDTLRGGAGNDTVNGGVGADLVLGASGDDTLRAGAGNDNLKGGAGNDALRGGPGNDTGNGGPGTDTCASVEVAKSC